MNSKLSAMIMASVMLVVAFAAALAPSTEGSDTAIGTFENPQYVIGTESVPYVVSATGSVTANLSMNAKAFDGPAFSAKVYRSDSSTFTVENGVIQGSITTENYTFVKDDDSGNHKITLTGDDTNLLTTGFYLIEITLVDTIGGNFNPVTLTYYYIAHISTTDLGPAVVLVKPGTGNSVTEISDALTFHKDTDYTGTFAKVKIGTGDNAVYLGIEEYDFYESNLPDGIDMKSNGEIAGKIISSAELTENAVGFTVYAINKNTGKAIQKGDFTYTVDDSQNENYFMYQIGSGEKKNYSVVGYSAIKNDESLTITVFNVDGTAITDATGFTAAYSADGMTGTGDSATFTGTLKPVDVGNDGKIVLSGLGNYTGIVQLQITKTVSGSAYTAVIHVMLVGPLVHSGLEPTVTSA